MLIKGQHLSNQIDFGATGVESVVQNVRTIITTRKGTLPLDRDFGINMDFLDKPMPVAMEEIRQDLFLQLPRYEPRATVNKIDFEFDQIVGHMMPIVDIDINMEAV